MKYKNIIKTFLLFLIFVIGILLIEGFVYALKYNIGTQYAIIEILTFTINTLRPILFSCIAIYGAYKGKKHLKADIRTIIFLIITVVHGILIYEIVFNSWIYSDLEEIYFNTPFLYYRINLNKDLFFDNIVAMSMGLLNHNPSLFLIICSLPFYILNSCKKQIAVSDATKSKDK